MRPDPLHLIRVTAVLAAAWLLCATAVHAAEAPPPARVATVTDTYFGSEVSDPYRWMETRPNPELDTWMGAQNDYTRNWFAQQPLRQALFERIRELQKGTASTRFVSQAGANYFFLETPADGNSARLVSKPLKGGATRVLFDPATVSTPQRRASVDFIGPAPDGRHVAFVVSHDGGEDWTLRIVDTISGRLLPDSLDRIATPVPSWDAQGRGFYYTRLQKLADDAPVTTKYDKQRVYYHALGTDPEKDQAVFGYGVHADIALDPVSWFPMIEASDDGHWLIASVQRGTDNDLALWLRDARKPDAPWRAIAGFDDGISSLQIHKDWIYVIAEKPARNGRVLRLDARRQNLADAQEWLAASDVVIADESGGIAVAADALYVVGLRQGRSVVRTVSYAKPNQASEVPLGADGELIEFDNSPRRRGVLLALQGPTLSPRVFRYDPDKRTLADTGVRAADPADFSAIATQRLEVPNGELRVPITLTARKDLRLDGSHPVLLVTYGSYGAISPMWFSAADLAWYERGGILVFAHVRGGGEKGAEWREGGRRNHKQNAVDDFLAVARWLVAQGYTAPQRLGIAGKSAGGVIMSAAVAQAPELFGAALFRVGVTDVLRMEGSEGGAANVNEFGTVKIEEDFRAMRRISGYANVRDGVAYPAVMLETGINDPRVPPWQLAKMAARLQAATRSDKPVLLRVDYNAGHGLGNSKLQVAELLADEYAFLLRNLAVEQKAVQPGSK